MVKGLTNAWKRVLPVLDSGGVVVAGAMAPEHLEDKDGRNLGTVPVRTVAALWMHGHIYSQYADRSEWPIVARYQITEQGRLCL